MFHFAVGVRGVSEATTRPESVATKTTRSAQKTASAASHSENMWQLWLCCGYQQPHDETIVNIYLSLLSLLSLWLCGRRRLETGDMGENPRPHDHTTTKAGPGGRLGGS